MAASVGNRQFNVEGRNGLISYGSRSHQGRKVPESIPTRDFFELQTPRPKFESQALQQEEEEGKEEEDDDVVWEFPEEEETAADPRDAGTADEWVKRNSHLVRLTGRHPFNCEAPLCRLMRHGFITPVSLHYVRNHGHVPRCSWDDWRVEVCGLVKRPMQLSMEQLVEEFRPRELPVTLVCAGNRRKEQNMVKQTIGFNWGAAGVSTSVWRGARLPDLLRRCGIMSKKKGALYVCFEGAEDLPGGGGSKYGTSISVDIAMDYARDVIVAYRQNGELLKPDHGFPVRVIIPGFIGGRMVKWLRCIRVSSVQSDSYYHHRDNKVLPSHVDADSAISQGWWNKPEYIINELNINSVITTPSHEEILPINSATTQRPYALKGYAYSGGGRKVIRVEVTFDGGETWKLCSITHPEKPTKFGKHWCWCFWELEVEVMEILSAKEIAVRAWDESMNTQPKDLTWNVMGMMNNCWFRVKLNLCMPHHGEIGLVFEHPTRPGNQSGGWMAREKYLEDTQLQANSSLKKSSSTPMMNTASKNITLSEVQKHNNAESAWIIVHNHVYDCTKFVKDHPGGMDSILINAGSDCTEEFDAIHSSKAKAMLEDYRIGELNTTSLTGGSSSSCESSPDNSVHGGNKVFSALRLAPITELPVSKQPPALNPKQNITCKLVSKKALSHDVRLFRFALPSPDQMLGLPTGKHIFVSAYIDDKLCMRAYTPVSSDDELGHFDLLVKIYFKGVHPKFPDGGLMSQYLETMAVGESIKVKGPVGHIQYHGQGHFTINGHTKLCKTIAMVGGGSGITPLYQVIRAILKDPMDETQIHLVYANRTENDILLREQLDQFSEHHSNFKVWYVINNSVKEGWNYSLGIISEEILRDHLPDGSSPDTLALMCGPPLMIQFACLPNLAKMNYDVKDSCFQF